MAEIENLNGVELLTKTTGSIADAAAWHVTDTLEDFGGDVIELTVESQSGYDEFDGHTARVSVGDVNAGEWEIVD